MNAVVQIHDKPSLVAKLAAKYSVDAEKMLHTLKATAFRGDVSTEQLMALCIVADQYDLNPWTKEIYAFPDRNNGIVPVVGVDGWSRIINSHPNFDGMEFKEGEANERDIPKWIECVIYRKDRSHPVAVKEYFSEVYRDVGPWKSHPRRMLRHKAMIQCARVAFGFAGIYEPDEAERIIEAPQEFTASPKDGLSVADPQAVDNLVGRVTDILAQDIDEDAQADQVFAVHQEVCTDADLYTALQDALKARGVIKSAGWKALVALGSKRFQERAIEGRR